MTQPLRVLLVDDDEVDRLTVRRALVHRDRALQVFEAPTAAAALDLLAHQPVDCVLLDHMLPDADSPGVVRSLRAAGHPTPVIVLTGHGDEQLAVDLMKAGVSDYLVKGRLTGEQLLQSVRSAVRVSRAEALAANAHRARDEAVALLDTLVGSAPVGIAFFDTDLRFARVNDALARINGLPVADHIGRSLAEIVPALHEQVAADLRTVLATGQPLLNLDVTGTTAADPGVVHDWIVNYYPVRSPSGQMLGVGATVVDISDRKRHQRELTQAKEVAEAANRSKDEFLSVLSHELRNPLTPVLMGVQALQEGKSPDEAPAILAMIRRNVELEARLIDDLLDLTRIAKGKLQLHLVPVNAHDLIRGTVENFRAEIDAKGLNLMVELCATRHEVLADPGRLHQVFWNLLNNAIKFTPPGGNVVVRTFDDGEQHLVAQVADSGVGIEPELLPKIFDAFEQAEGSKSRKFGGLGLGLAICRALVRMHWGVLTAHSRGKNTGAAFSVRLAGHVPARDSASAVAVPPGPELKPESPTAGVPEAASKRVLMVDDHDDTRIAMKRLLERSGYQVTTATTVRDALASAGDGRGFDILISDIGLPDGSGLEIMRHLRERAATDRAVRGIALSGFGMEDDIRRSHEAGFEHHLTKPVTFDRLKAVLQALDGEAASKADRT